MIKDFKVSLLGAVTLLGLVGCAPKPTPEVADISTEVVESSTEASTKKVCPTTISIQDAEGNPVGGFSLVVDEDEELPLLTVMEEEFEVVHEEGFIQSIDGLSQDVDENLFWVFEVNGEMGEVGAKDFMLSPGDDVEWMLKGF